MKRTLLLILLCAVFLTAAGYGGWQLYVGAEEYRSAEEAYEGLTQFVQTPALQRRTPDLPQAETLPEPGEPEDTTNWPVVDFEALQAINPEIVAWIYIEGTDIHYPVVHGSDNSRYLTRLFDGSPNGAGSIFMDYRNSGDLTDRNTVFYGHNMQNGSMFAQITNYREQDFYDRHPTALILTPEGNYKLEFFAGYVTHVTTQAWKLEFGSDEEFAAWLEEAKEVSSFQSPVTPTELDRIVTLSTCTYEYNDARYVLLGVLRSQKEEPQ